MWFFLEVWLRSSFIWCNYWYWNMKKIVSQHFLLFSETLSMKSNSKSLQNQSNSIQNARPSNNNVVGKLDFWPYSHLEDITKIWRTCWKHHFVSSKSTSFCWKSDVNKILHSQKFFESSGHVGLIIVPLQTVTLLQILRWRRHNWRSGPIFGRRGHSCCQYARHGNDLGRGLE